MGHHDKLIQGEGHILASELNKAYYNLMMVKEGEKPDQFIVLKMDRACKKLRNDATVNVPEQQYL
jgi:hypothetical protein